MDLILGWETPNCRSKCAGLIIGCFHMSIPVIMFIIMNVYAIFVCYNEHYEYQKDHFAAQNHQIIG
jgi:hypothetical protein